MQLAAYVGKKYQYSIKPSTLFLKSGNYPKLGRELMLLSMLPKYQETAAVEPKTEDAYLENSQIMVASSKNWFVAAKGGHNAESHNHNDMATSLSITTISRWSSTWVVIPIPRNHSATSVLN